VAGGVLFGVYRHADAFVRRRCTPPATRRLDGRPKFYADFDIRPPLPAGLVSRVLRVISRAAGGRFEQRVASGFHPTNYSRGLVLERRFVPLRARADALRGAAGVSSFSRRYRSLEWNGGALRMRRAAKDADQNHYMLLLPWRGAHFSRPAAP